MRLLILALCLMMCSSLPGEATDPLRIVAVVRQGLPPYEEGERLYRLEGDGCALLKVAETLVLRRTGEKVSPGRLKVMEAHWDHAMAILAEAGDTYPLIGDLALRIDPPAPLPPVLASGPVETKPTPDSLGVRSPVREAPKEAPIAIAAKEEPPAPPTVVAPATPKGKPQPLPLEQRQAIYFIKGDASLSPGALKRLKVCTGLWGTQGRWMLSCPENPGLSPDLQRDRIRVLCEELRRQGVGALDVRTVPPEAPGKYDVIYISCESQQVRPSP